MDLFATGLGLGESPRWHDGRLWVCDWVVGEVLSFDETGQRRVELTMDGLPFSVDWLPDGRTVLTAVEGVVAAGEDGSLSSYGATGQAWNEIVVDPRGNTFVNSPGFDLMGGEPPRAGTVWVVRPDGAAREVAGDVWFPNGMAVSADGSTLVVAESYGHCLTGFDIASDGSLTNRRVWADLGEGTGRHLSRCGGRRVVRRRTPPLRPRRRGRRGTRGRGGGPGLLRLHARRRGRPNPVRRRRQLGRHQRDRPGRADRAGAHAPGPSAPRWQSLARPSVVGVRG